MKIYSIHPYDFTYSMENLKLRLIFYNYVMNILFKSFNRRRLNKWLVFSGDIVICALHFSV